MSDLGRAACVARDAAGSKPRNSYLEMMMCFAAVAAPLLNHRRSRSMEPHGRHALGIFSSDQSASLIGLNAVPIALSRAGSPFDATPFPVR